MSITQKSWPPIQLVLFDLAGTTVKDRGEVARAFTTALHEHNISVTPEELSSVRGSSKRQVVLNFIPDDPERVLIAERVYDSFHHQLKQLYEEQGIQEVDGARAVFEQLRDAGIQVGFTTGFDRSIAGLLLDALHWRQIADVTVCAEEVREGRPAPYMIFRAMEISGVKSVRTVAILGDTALDLQAGYNAGVQLNIGVLTGAHDRSLLEKQPHTHILESVAELPRVLFAI